jgi:hypothetical protein
MLLVEKMKHVNGLQSVPSLMRMSSQMPLKERLSSYPHLFKR